MGGARIWFFLSCLGEDDMGGDDGKLGYMRKEGDDGSSTTHK